MLVTVECIDTFDPPRIRITFAGQVAYDVSTQDYEILKPILGLPDSPCGGIGSH